MAEVIIALGSNLGDRHHHLMQARSFLSDISDTPLLASSIYETEPVGQSSTHYYYNAVCRFGTRFGPLELLEHLKEYERQHGRDLSSPRWANRTIDLDIIDFDRRTIHWQRLNVPHPDYHKRLFVLAPLQEIIPEWCEVSTNRPVDELIAAAPKIEVFKTSLIW